MNELKTYKFQESKRALDARRDLFAFSEAVPAEDESRANAAAGGPQADETPLDDKLDAATEKAIFRYARKIGRSSDAGVISRDIMKMIHSVAEISREKGYKSRSPLLLKRFDQIVLKLLGRH